MKLTRNLTLGYDSNSFFFDNKITASAGTNVEVLKRNTGNETSMGGETVLIRVNGVVREVNSGDLN